MTTFECYGRIYATKFLGTVEAETAEEAQDKAWKELDSTVSLCHVCVEEAENAEIEKIDVVPEDEA